VQELVICIRTEALLIHELSWFARLYFHLKNNMVTKKTLNPAACSSGDFSGRSTSIYGSRSLMIRLTMFCLSDRLICSIWIRSI